MRTARALTTSQIQELEAELHDERARLERSIQAQAAAEEASSGEESPYGLASANGAIGIDLETRTSTRLEAIVAALDRIAQGTYGVCAGCQKPIPYGRLIVMPESALCLACGNA